MTTAPTAGSRIPPLLLASPRTFDALAYLDFLYGFGAGPGLDLGVPLACERVATPTGCVHRQGFERALAYANVGDVAAEVVLELPAYHRSGVLLMALHLEPHSVEVLYPTDA